ncbi:MAG: GGDEF domain-containing protein [Candidatus Omnitrophica bacterium]|nr:GGDEF domain-containing protein [Candidatus Omnitrophota bacterium]
MLKRYPVLVLAIFGALAAVVFFNAKISLLLFIFYPALLLPYFYFSQDTPGWLRRTYPVLTGLLGGYFLFAHFSYEILALVFMQILLGVGFFFYERDWNYLLIRETEQKESMQKELGSMSQKYDSRLASLHHLEKQVTGLLDLFEVAKEFSEYLSFEGIAEILFKRVKPLFPFQQLELLIVQDELSTSEKALRFLITPEGVTLSEDPVSDKEKAWLEKLKENKSMIQADLQWVFPLLAEEHFSSLLMIEGGHPDDLTKFEVLSAFLNLQVAKIRLYNSVKELSIRDSLTHVFVRRHFLERFEEELKRAVKYSIPLVVLMLDIDLFKRYNDDYGHIAGDATLQQVSSMICQSLRKVDIISRYGGEEFAVVIPETRKDGALEISERIRSNIARNMFKIYNTETRVTVSIGLALYAPDGNQKNETIDYPQLAFELIQNADNALYRAKEEGRNRVVLYSHS